MFVHDALVDYIMCGDTSISASNLRNKTSKMSKVAPGNTVNVFEQQFQVCHNAAIFGCVFFCFCFVQQMCLLV